ncbi:hypothetical protein IFM89_028618 [Coptis chinensis]|uniref:Ribonucleotide reductase large subunit C-terminal domain-containing protein n=1 Tax=Coptis chinensis TaxID=261450 RepID=A0A835IGS0_9MAGN|nr:hypothetical protein IFM89_028618 [Coptis chinensis]
MFLITFSVGLKNFEIVYYSLASGQASTEYVVSRNGFLPRTSSFHFWEIFYSSLQSTNLLGVGTKFLHDETISVEALAEEEGPVKSNQQNLGTIKSSNLCTEIIEYTSAVCSLASIALPRYVREKGLADACILLGMPFDSPEAQQLNKDIFETIYYHALKASYELAPKEVEKPRRAGRKILLGSETKEYKNGDAGHKGHSTDDNYDSVSFLEPKIMGIAVPGMFILCCGLLCPCFCSKRKEASRNVLSTKFKYHQCMKKLTQSRPTLSVIVDSVPSGELNSASENIPDRLDSPLRGPKSPLWMLAAPLRVPPSPSQFTMSPQMKRIGSVHLNLNQVMKATENFLTFTTDR